MKGREIMKYICRFCGKKFNAITHTHLKKQHHISSVADYNEIVEAKFGKDALKPVDEHDVDIKIPVSKPPVVPPKEETLNDVLIRTLAR